MTRQFNVKDEIEIKDNLDTKPDGCENQPLQEKLVDYETTFLWFNGKSTWEYANLVEQILDSYPESVNGIDVSWRSVGDHRSSRVVDTSLSFPQGLLDKGAAESLSREVLFVGNALPGKSFHFSVFRNALGTELRFETQQIPHDPPLVRELYSTAFRETRCNRKALDVAQAILDRTELTVVKDTLVITTRLPRGSLPSLLAVSAK